MANREGVIFVAFADWMKEVRKSKGLSVSECAMRAGVKQPVWTEWEDAAESKEWRLSTIKKIAFALGEPETIARKEADRTGGGEESTIFLARQIEQHLLRLRPETRPAAERMLIDTARHLGELMSVH